MAITPLTLTTSLMRTLVVPRDNPYEAREMTCADVEPIAPSAPTGNYVQYQGVKVPDRLLTWAKSPQKTESFKYLFSENPTKITFVPCPPNIGKNKDDVCFYVIRSDRQRGYFSQAYKTLDEAYNDIFYLCETFGENATFPEITQLLDKAKREYLIKTGQY